jgi:hypothetical protein
MQSTAAGPDGRSPAHESGRLRPVNLPLSRQRTSGGRRRWFFIFALGVILAPLACLELAYRIELTTIAERPPTPIAPLPPLVMQVAALELLRARTPETRAIYPWTAAMAVARIVWTRGRPPA